MSPSHVVTKMERKSSLVSIPWEIKRRIMMDLDITSLPALALSCKAFYHTYGNNQGPIIYSIVTNGLGPLLPIAVALHAAKHVGWKAMWPLPSSDELMANVHQFGRTYLDPNTEFAIQRKDISYPTAFEMMAIHRTIQKWARDYARISLYHFYPLHRQNAREPTATEVTRVQKVMYAMEITRELLPYIIEQDGVEDLHWNMLWHYFAPWDNNLAEKIHWYMKGIVMKRCYPALKMIYIDGDRVGLWLTKYGLPGLDKLDRRDWLGKHSFALSSFAVLKCDLANDPERHFRTALFCKMEEGFSWLPVKESITTRSLNIDHLTKRFPEEAAARDIWYFRTVPSEDKYFNLVSWLWQEW
ncbi:hypothetical protein GGR54DRAFT_602779 [Hypoxylon sp. NC1633]|nr:hypothetical protein GGR54DRAFT_602779 [Hypoxylon sp. NC1633]